jgi:hypothetical protein
MCVYVDGGFLSEMERCADSQSQFRGSPTRCGG